MKSLKTAGCVAIVSLILASQAMAVPVSVCCKAQGFPIEPSTTYSFVLSGLPDPVSPPVLTITETNGDFNKSDETITVKVDAIHVGTFAFATDNGVINRTLEITVPAPEFDVAAILADSRLTIDVITSSKVDQSVGIAGNGLEGTSWLNVALAYEAEQLPEPATILLITLGGLALLRKRKA